KNNKINLGFNWGDLGLVRMGIRTSPLFFTTETKTKKAYFQYESMLFFCLVNS
ncbi:MAG: Unknown protein, partial [uncultured Aureispira sp.]